MKKSRLAATSLVALAATAVGASFALAGSERFVPSAVERPGNNVELPLYKGTAAGRSVYYVVLDTSSGDVADRLGVPRVNKDANVRGTGAVQRVSGSITRGTVQFPGTVDFAPVRVVDLADPKPGSIGDAAYSPLLQFPNGDIVNAPQVARDQNGDGRIDLAREGHDKVVSIDTARMRVVLKETDGFANGAAVRYVSTDASVALAATLEGATLAPKLGLAPFAGGDGTDSARASLALFLNGQTGAQNPNRQGLGSALAGDGDPLNVLAWTPNQGRYSPLWDVHMVEWTPAQVAAGRNTRQTDFDDVVDLAEEGRATGPGGAPFGPAGIVVNCPIISQA